MIFDLKVPEKLKRTQMWFGGIIERPIDAENNMNPMSLRGIPMEIEAAEYICKSPTLRPAQRIELYNQQYWWRLLSILQDNFPFLVRLFGTFDFNKTIAMPYLSRYRPDTWSLSRLGKDLPLWIQEEYQLQDKLLVYDAASIDAAFNKAFFGSHYPKIAGDPMALFQQTFLLQPHISLFDIRYDLFAFRNLMIEKEADYWLDHDFPPLEKTKRHYFIVYRTVKNHLNWDVLDPVAYLLLSQISQGISLECLCDWLEAQEESIRSIAAEKFPFWLQEWCIREWVYIQQGAL